MFVTLLIGRVFFNLANFTMLSSLAVESFAFSRITIVVFTNGLSNTPVSCPIMVLILKKLMKNSFSPTP